ncbi:hypothetical protein PCANC_27023 [Puccinia coronata f. sp. avenae]|uniref:Uncharacterized protein n=1 Tax=Puccinia coronata f. sp. avenae TaxID=200324 RepID=A0A2N5TYP4_9BASI|nr:hypothetical protein PCANC_27023 [Puccinia coronata f. sp. avenae]
MPHLHCLPVSNSPDSPALLNANCLTTNNRESTAVETSQAGRSTQPLAANKQSHVQVGSEASTSDIPQRFEFQPNRLLFGHAACQMIVSPTSSLQPPFLQIGLASTTLFSLINPPTTFLFGGLFEGTLQQDVYLLHHKSNLESPLLMIDCFKTCGLAPSPCSHALLTSYKSHLIVWGGQTSPTTPVSDNWLY